MKRIGLLLALWLSLLSLHAQAENPLRIFMRVGEKTHGPGQHDHPLFLLEWREMLNKRGAQVSGKMAFPSAAELEKNDVLVMYAADAGAMTPEERANLDKFTKRGGGVVIIHDAICGDDPAWFKTVVGGAWEHKKSKYFEGDIAMYYVDREHPITRGASNFDFDDELYYDLHLMPEARVLAATYKPDERNSKAGKMYPSVYDIVPQMWVYEKENYRAFVCIPGHNYKTFNLPHFRAVLLRGIAWAGKRDVDSLCSKEELASLRYPAGGPTAPEKAAAKIKLHPDFDINLVASEPLIEKPISIDWDAQGRMWIAETPEYPAGRRGGRGKLTADGLEDRPATDRISILEDTNGDGLMDKKSIFYEGLDLVTSLVFYKDGVIVAQAPDIYWLRDTDGDGKAETKETLYTGFGIRDTHAVISNMRWGMDGWIYATVGYSGGHIKSGDGKTDFGDVGSGVVRFLPDGRGMEQVSSKNGNTWGLDFGWDGEIFFSQANGQHINHVVMPENVLARGKMPGTTSYKSIEDHKEVKPIRDYSKQAYVQIDHVGGFTAASGATVYGGGAWPDGWDYNYFVSEPTVNMVHRDILKPTGVTYVASKEREQEFLASDDLWFRPIHTMTGPDGALYILDFYNQAVVHNDTRGPQHGPANAAVRPDRDHHFGRIWRVQHKQAKKFEIPNLAQATPEQLLAALEHPNYWVRMTAHRKLVERKERDLVPALEQLAASEKPAPGRIHALWVLQNLGACTYDMMAYAVEDPNEQVQKNACRVIATSKNLKWDMPLHFALIRVFQSPNPRVALEALVAEGSFRSGKPSQDMIVSLYPKFTDPWLQSAVVGVAAKDQLEYMESIFNADPKGVESLLRELADIIIRKQDVGLVAGVMVRLGLGPETADPLKKIVLDKLASDLDPKIVVPWSPPLQRFFESLLGSHNADLVAATLPLIVRWDKEGHFGNAVPHVLKGLLAAVHDSKIPEEQRLSSAVSLLAVRQLSPEVVPTVAGLMTTGTSPAFQKGIIEALGKVAEPNVAVELITAYPNLSRDMQELVFDQLLKRSDWTLILLEVIASKQIDLATLGPISINRLRTHPDKAVAERAHKVIDEIRGPQIKEKNELIAKFKDIVLQPGNIENGKKLYEQNCAVCHKFDGQGKDVAPDLTGMGAHGPGELLVHILDPNRVVEENFISVSIETKDDQSFDGIVGRENKSSIVLRNASGDIEIEKSKIARRKATGRSLMPEGFEALGGEGLRDLLGYICGADNKYRIIDLTPAFTANTLRGIYVSEESVNETLKFKKFGMTKVDGVPFQVADPTLAPSQKNVIVLKGGEGYAKTLPQQVEISNLNIPAEKLHFLGGVGGWAWPCCGGNKNENLPVAEITINYAYGMAETIVLTNGLEIADYNGNFEVPGSKAVPGLLEHGQVRAFSKTLMTRAPIQKITIKSLDNAVAPTFVGITAEVAKPGTVVKTNGPRVETIDDLADFYPKSFGDIRISMLGGGSSHDFDRWFNVADSTTLAYATDAPVNYTEQLDYFRQGITNAHVLYLCSNQAMTNNALRKEIFDFANAGGGFLLIHPALWYNWKDWPEYNRVLVGGGARGHDKYGPVEVTITDRDHPIMHNIPKSFTVSDELYRLEIDQQGTPIKVLASGKNPETGATYPVVWIVQHPKARIVCISLGHDGSSHENLAFRVMLQNCMAWVAGKLE